MLDIILIYLYKDPYFFSMAVSFFLGGVQESTSHNSNMLSPVHCTSFSPVISKDFVNIKLCSGKKNLFKFDYTFRGLEVATSGTMCFFFGEGFLLKLPSASHS